MQEVFEKIIEKLEEIREQKTCTKEKCDEKEICRICVVDDVIEIMKQEAETKLKAMEEKESKDASAWKNHIINRFMREE